MSKQARIHVALFDIRLFAGSLLEGWLKLSNSFHEKLATENSFDWSANWPD